MDPGVLQLREILFATEAKEIAQLRERIQDPGERAQDVGEVLAQAVVVSTGKDDRLSKSLKPTIASSLEETARENPDMLADAIFPILGPAIRKSINDTFQTLVQGLQTTLDYTTTSQGWKWRWEAWRTGRPFAEVVLYHTLVFRVEQLFLINRSDSGLLQHVHAAGVEVRDGDMVSNMLSAITDFAKDSFEAKPGAQLNSLNLGDLTVWIETGPKASLAAVIRGNAPLSLRQEMQVALERIHNEQRRALADYDGNVTPFEAARPTLEECLRSEYGAGQSDGKSSPTSAYVALGVALFLLAWFVGSHFHERGRWNEFFAALREEEGIVVNDIEKRGGVYHVVGLRDPLAANPLEILRQRELEEADFDAVWEPYYATTPEMLIRRARVELEAPDTVRFEVNVAELVVRGEAPAEWIRTLIPRTSRLYGIRSVNQSQLKAADSAPPTSLEQIEATTLRITRERQLVREDQPLWPRLLSAVRAHFARPDARSLLILGEATTETDRELAAGLADLVRQNLVQNGVDRRRLFVQGILAAGSASPADSPSRPFRITFRRR